MKKSVFVTGGTIGSGFATAAKFAEAGYSVFIASRSQERAQEAADKIAAQYGVHAKGYGLGIRDEEAVKAVFADIDAQDCFVETVVLNAANMGFGNDPAKGLDFFEQTVEEVLEVFETNLVWNFMVIRQAAIRMREHGKGAIVFIGSNTSHCAIPNRMAYSTSKGGINSMSKCLAVDLGKYGIRSNVVLPGTIKTDRWVAMGNTRIVDGTFTPIGDISDFEDIANAAFFLGTDLAKNITGTELMVDGGMTCQLYPQLLNVLKKEKIAQQNQQ